MSKSSSATEDLSASNSGTRGTNPSIECASGPGEPGQLDDDENDALAAPAGDDGNAGTCSSAPTEARSSARVPSSSRSKPSRSGGGGGGRAVAAAVATGSAGARCGRATADHGPRPRPILDLMIRFLSSGSPRWRQVTAESRCCPSAMCSRSVGSIGGAASHTPPLAGGGAWPGGTGGFWKNLLSESTCRTEFRHVPLAVL